LDEVVKLDVEDQHTSLMVVDELFLEPKPERVCHGFGRQSDLDELRGDNVIDPRENNAVHLLEMRINDIVEVGIRKAIEEEDLPLIVVWREDVEEDGNHRLDVEDSDDHSMKGSDRGISLGCDVCLFLAGRRRMRGVEP
jgi:hypothetical protein